MQTWVNEGRIYISGYCVLVNNHTVIDLHEHIYSRCSPSGFAHCKVCSVFIINKHWVPHGKVTAGHTNKHSGLVDFPRLNLLGFLRQNPRLNHSWKVKWVVKSNQHALSTTVRYFTVVKALPSHAQHYRLKENTSEHTHIHLHLCLFFKGIPHRDTDDFYTVYTVYSDH